MTYKNITVTKNPLNGFNLAVSDHFLGTIDGIHDDKLSFFASLYTVSLNDIITTIKGCIKESNTQGD